jgi:hypothetical protein
LSSQVVCDTSPSRRVCYLFGQDLPAGVDPQRVRIGQHGFARFRGRYGTPRISLARRGAKGAREQHELAELNDRAARTVAGRQGEDAARQLVDPSGQRRRLAVDQSRRDAPAPRGGIVDEGGQAHPQLVADPLLERVERIRYRALGILGSLRHGSLAPRRLFRILKRLRFGKLRHARVLGGGRCIGARRLWRAAACAPSPEPITDPGRRVGGCEGHDRLRVEPQQAEHVFAWKFA